MKRSGLLQGVIIYTASSSLGGLVGFLLLPVLTRYLSPHDYGVVEIFSSIVAALTGVLMFGGDFSVSKNYYVVQEAVRTSVVANVVGVIIDNSLVLVILTTLIVLSTSFFSTLFKVPGFLVPLAVAVAGCNAINTIMLLLFQLEKNPKGYALFTNTRTLLDLAVSLLAIVLLNYKWPGRLAGMASAAFVYLAISMGLMNSRRVRPSLDLSSKKDNYTFGLPLIGAHLSGWANEMIDRVLIADLLGVGQTGIYSVGYRIGMVTMMVETAFSRAWAPFFYESLAKNTFTDSLRVVRATYIYLVLLLAFSLAFGLLASTLMKFFVGTRFRAGSEIVLPVSMAYFFDGAWKMFIGYLVYEGRTKMYSAILSISAVINVLLLILLLPRYGIVGAAWATLVSFFAGCILTVIAATRVHKMPWLTARAF